MGNLSSSEHRTLLTSPLYREYETERKVKHKGEADFSPEEVCWLIYLFQKNKRELSGSMEQHNTLSQLLLSQAQASQVMVLGKPLQLYPMIARRVWSVLDPAHTKSITFMIWIDLLRVIALGTFTEKMAMAFKLFQKETIERRDMEIVFAEIGDFLSEIGHGITDAVEFLVIKSFSWDEIFSHTERLNEGDWIAACEAYSALIAPFDVLNVIIGKDIRLMDDALKTPRVFGQPICKLAFGYASNESGRILVPEVLLSGCRLIASSPIKYSNLFDSKLGTKLFEKMSLQLNTGLPLKRILLNEKYIEKKHYYAVARLVRAFCDQLPRPVFGFQACGRLVEVQKQNRTKADKLALFIGIFTEMRTLSKIFFQVLLSLFKTQDTSQYESTCKIFSKSRLFRYSEGDNKVSKQNRVLLADILLFMIQHAEHFQAITIGESINPWQRIQHLEGQIQYLQQKLAGLGVAEIAPPTPGTWSKQFDPSSRLAPALDTILSSNFYDSTDEPPSYSDTRSPVATQVNSRVTPPTNPRRVSHLKDPSVVNYLKQTKVPKVEETEGGAVLLPSFFKDLPSSFDSLPSSFDNLPSSFDTPKIQSSSPTEEVVFVHPRKQGGRAKAADLWK